MFDISFFQEAYNLKKDIISNKLNASDCDIIFSSFEQHRSKKPFLFSIETTNICNMTCLMCPRTTEMNRKIQNMDMAVFKRVAEQIFSHDQILFNKWVNFIENQLDIREGDEGENPFYFLISSMAVTMHGFGEPLLDSDLKERIETLTKHGIQTYFSCNPANVNIEKIRSLFEAGLNCIKFSVDSINEDKMKEIRGSKADHSKALEKIHDVLKMKKEGNYHAKIIACMIKLNKDQDKEADEFMKVWENEDICSYIKSLDNQWYYKDQKSEKAKSHYESQYCEFPWTSLSVMVDGTVVPCTQDFNCEMTMGNVMEQSLEEIWNSEKYKNFRMMHIKGEFQKNYRCKNRCDIRQVADFLN